jgi:uncharacterized membrane protein YdjX (TVP38/TMEM64 family)
MLNSRLLLLLTLVCLVATALALYLISGIQPQQIQIALQQVGGWAPLLYILLYTAATLLILPSTALNLTGGALFGIWWGTLWTTIAAVTAAIAAFAFTRTVGRDLMVDRFVGRWQAMDAEIQQGGLFYMFAIRLLPIIPYGLVNFAAGLTSIRFRDYLIGTVLGTLPGVLPFVMIGSSGLEALQTGNLLPLLGALTLTGILVGGATWYRRRRSDRRQALQVKSQEAGTMNQNEPDS